MIPGVALRRPAVLGPFPPHATAPGWPGMQPFATQIASETPGWLAGGAHTYQIERARLYPIAIGQYMPALLRALPFLQFMCLIWPCGSGLALRFDGTQRTPAV